MSVTMADGDALSALMYFDGSGCVPAPLPWIGSQAAAHARMRSMQKAPERKPPHPPPRLVVWWESLEVWQQLAISFPVLAVFTFVINLGPFNQPILRSVFYGLFEGGVLSGLLAVATRTERDSR